LSSSFENRPGGSNGKWPFSFASTLFIDYVYSFESDSFSATLLIVAFRVEFTVAFAVELDWCSYVVFFKVSFNFFEAFTLLTYVLFEAFDPFT
jgi:hypothetical protein